MALINWNTKEKFGEAVILSTREKELRDLTEADFDGHEKFESTGKMYEEYRKYYGEKVTPESVVKIIKFELQG